jgi:hypothetical protein
MSLADLGLSAAPLQWAALIQTLQKSCFLPGPHSDAQTQATNLLATHMTLPCLKGLTPVETVPKREFYVFQALPGSRALLPEASFRFRLQVQSLTSKIRVTGVNALPVQRMFHMPSLSLFKESLDRF